jgi:membrane protein involved in colicin uptake
MNSPSIIELASASGKGQIVDTIFVDSQVIVDDLIRNQDRRRRESFTRPIIDIDDKYERRK